MIMFFLLSISFIKFVYSPQKLISYCAFKFSSYSYLLKSEKKSCHMKECCHILFVIRDVLLMSVRNNF